MTITAKVNLTAINRGGAGDGEWVSLQFQPDYRDGRNAAWAQATPSLSLSMTLRADVAARLGLHEGQSHTLSIDIDVDEHAIVGPPSSLEDADAPRDHAIFDPTTGEVRDATKAEADAAGYDTAGGAAQGLSAGPEARQVFAGETAAPGAHGGGAELHDETNEAADEHAGDVEHAGDSGEQHRATE